ncbi:DedA family protein [Falsibacillus pallidus]|uniref:DedA family protein n=1 Tax=Falsibacillus pallidus TaxID=493781 RepID=UPI003D99C46D
MSHLITLFEHHPYVILFLGTFLELLALPISAELLMSYAGYLVYLEKMNFIFALLTAYAAAGAGITSTFWIGKAGGYRLIEKYGRFLNFGPQKYQKTASWLERSGSKLLVFAYFIPGVRHITGYVSGISRMKNRTFFIPAYVGVLIWGTSFITIGKVLGPEWDTFHHVISHFIAEAMIVGISLAAVYIIFRIYKGKIIRFLLMRFEQFVELIKMISGKKTHLIFLSITLIGIVIMFLVIFQEV